MSTLLKQVILTALFAILILPVQTLLAQEAHPDWEGTSQIAGKVLDESRKGIRNADVKLRFAAAGAPPPAEEAKSDQPNRAAAMLLQVVQHQGRLRLHSLQLVQRVGGSRRPTEMVLLRPMVFVQADGLYRWRRKVGLYDEQLFSSRKVSPQLTR